ncbi:hypothetical protein CGZ80_01175 [Rhodopirellula sp. MGV]|nr:hypothetical protein CGZ80_01175 [Rhodopirellula sp. MGV]
MWGESKERASCRIRCQIPGHHAFTANKSSALAGKKRVFLRLDRPNLLFWQSPKNGEILA